jgi:hypothetical protein
MHRVRVIDAAGVIHAAVGTGQQGCSGFDGGLASRARLSAPQDMTFDARGNLYLTDADCGLLRIDTGGHMHLMVAP